MTKRLLGTFALLAVCSCSGLSIAQFSPSMESMPQKVIIGQDTYFDIGPPFDYYEIYVLDWSGQGTTVERITLSPPGDACLQPSKIQTATVVLPQALPQLLGNKSPCLIPERALRREAKRCKHCLTFSGAMITMQVECGGKDRLLPFDILERDWFDNKPNTPAHTSQTLQLLSFINGAMDPNVVNQLTSPTSDPAEQATVQASSNIADLASGKFDTLFRNSTDIPSQLYKQSQVAHRPPSVTLVNTSELAPLDAKLPLYPPIARAAHIEGDVTLMLEIQPDGKVGQVKVEGGPEMLRAVAVFSANAWIFPRTETKQSIGADIAFRLNCADVTTSSASTK